jgi:hypothetical protein
VGRTSLQVEQHDAFQRQEWRAQRVGWLMMALLVLAALTGLLGGPGPLSWTTATGADGALQVEYQRLGHFEADEVVTVTVASAAVTGDSVDVELAGGWLQAVDVRGITPEPREQLATPYGLRLTFATEPGAELSVQMTYRPAAIGNLYGGVRLEGETVGFGQFVYP